MAAAGVSYGMERQPPTKRGASTELEEALKDASLEDIAEHLDEAFGLWRDQGQDELKNGVQYQRHLRAEWE